LALRQKHTQTHVHAGCMGRLYLWAGYRLYNTSKPGPAEWARTRETLIDAGRKRGGKGERDEPSERDKFT
jgi:hypothetical protein